jgi:hypothetical protein
LPISRKIDTDGAQFAANVYEYGTDEIIKYGFVFGPNEFPTINNADVIKQSGKPDQLFSLKATYAMKLGAKYHVAAYVRTETGITYSKTETFTSKGSVGFIVERIDIPNPAYFGDTITIKGKNFSRIRTNYEVEMESARALVTEVGDDFMKFTIPSNISFRDNQDAFTTTVKVAEKEFRAELIIRFRDPVFRLKDTRKILFKDTVFIEGDYLESSDFEIRYDDKEGGISKLPLVFQDSKKIGFKPEVEFFEKKPLITLKIRGKKYPLQNIFELLPTEFVPAQSASISAGQTATAEVNNINPYKQAFNKVVSSTDDYFWWEMKGDQVNINFDILSNRQIEFYFLNHGIKSSIPFKVNNTHPFLNLLRAELGFQNKAVAQNDIGYFLTSRGIWELIPNTKTLNLLPSTNSPTTLGGIFAIAAPNGKLYMGNENQVLNSQTHDLYSFDPQTKQLSKLAPIPTANSSPQGVYATQQYLYYEAAESLDLEGNMVPPAVYRYGYTSNQWEKVGWKHSQSYPIQFPTFRYRNTLYGIAIDTQTQKSSLKLFDTNTESWSKVADMGFYGEFYGNELFVIDDFVYGSFLEGMVRFPLVSGVEKQYPLLGFNNSDSNFLKMAIQSGGKFYIYNELRLIREYDPAYFPN